MRSLCTLLSLTCLASAQAFVGGDVIVTNYQTTNALYRWSPISGIAAIPLGMAATGLSAVVGTRRGDIVTADANTGNVIVVPPIGNAAIIANVPGALRVVEDIDGEFVVTSFTSRALLRVTRAGQVTPIVTLTSPSRPFDVIIDNNGDYIYCDDTGQKGVFRVNRVTLQVTTIHAGSPFSLPQGLAFFANGDYAVIDGITDAVYRIDRGTNVPVVFVPNATLGNNPDGITESFDGGFYVATSSSAANYIVKISSNGTLTPVFSGAPFTNLEDVSVIPFVTGPTNLTTGPGAVFPFQLEMPLQPTKLFSVALSGGMFPGLPFPNSDPRALTVNPDGLFVATLFVNLPPILQNFTGVTDANGKAAMTMDVQVLPAGALAGIKLFTQGITLDPAAPNGIGGVTSFSRLAFQ